VRARRCRLRSSGQGNILSILWHPRRLSSTTRWTGAPNSKECFLPGTHYSNLAPEKIPSSQITSSSLPWNLRAKLRATSGIKAWGGKFVVPIRGEGSQLKLCDATCRSLCGKLSLAMTTRLFARSFCIGIRCGWLERNVPVQYFIQWRAGHAPWLHFRLNRMGGQLSLYARRNHKCGWIFDRAQTRIGIGMP